MMRKRKQAIVKRGYHRSVFGVPCEVYSRIVGYLRPVRNWNEGKRQEWRDRVAYKLGVVV